MKLILTRHGETEENKLGIMQGHLPGTLSKEGIEQAKKLAVRLKDEKIDAIYCSDLTRAVTTSKEILKYHPHIPVVYLKDLREGDIGSYTGKFKDLLKPRERPVDFESYDSMKKRAKTVIDIAYKKYPTGTILLIGHGGINKAITSMLLNKNVDELETQENTAINIFEITEDGNHLHLMNSVEHLK